MHRHSNKWAQVLWGGLGGIFTMCSLLRQIPSQIKTARKYTRINLSLSESEFYWLIYPTACWTFPPKDLAQEKTFA